jgi:hypothetical protein
MNLLRRSRFGGAAAAAALLVLGSAAPAAAHHGYAGPVRLYLQDVNVEPKAEGWVLHATLNDSGNGKAAPGFVVHANGTGPAGAAFGPLTLSDGDADGRYESVLGPLPAGDWSLAIDVTDAPGSEERAIPLKRSWPVTLRPGQALDLLGRLPAPTGESSSGSGSAVPLVLGVAAGLAGLGVAGRQLARRRTHVIPTP